MATHRRDHLATVFSSHPIQTPIYPRSMLKLACPPWGWATLWFFFSTTLGLPQTEISSSQSTEALLGIIGAIQSGVAVGASRTQVPIGLSITAIHTVEDALVVGSTTLTAGGPAYTTNTYTISLGSSDLLEINDKTTSLVDLATSGTQFVIGSSIPATRAASGIVVLGSKTLSVGGPAIITETYTLSLGPSGALHVNGETTKLPPATSVPAADDGQTGDGQPGEGETDDGAFVIKSSISATHVASDVMALGTESISVGGPAYTTDTYTLSLGPSGVLNVNGKTTTLPAAAEPTAETPEDSKTDDNESVIGGSITAVRTATDAVVIGSQTLSVGGSALSTDTYVVSLGPSGILDINSETSTLRAFLLPTQTTTTLSDTLLIPITSTQTSPPPEVSTEIIHPPGVTTNTWITTIKDSAAASSIVPGVWCDACAPGGGSGIVVIWDFPPSTGVQFDWRKTFPGLPKFKFPCIKFFGRRFAGDCPPPESDDNQQQQATDDPQPTEGPDPDPEDPEDDPEECSTSTTVTNCK